MNVKEIYELAKVKAGKNLPTILIVGGVVGTCTSLYLACKTTPKAIEVLDKLEKEKLEKKEPVKLYDKVVTLAPVYWPVAVLATTSMSCFIFANSISVKRQAAALAAYQLSEKKLQNYQEAIIKTVGEKKSEEIKDKVAEMHMKNNPIVNKEVIVTGTGDCLCYDSVSGRYFNSNIEKIKQAENQINKMLLSENCASLNDFYDIIGLPGISIGDSLGWTMKNVGEFLEIRYSSQLASDGKPCLVIEYSVVPTYWDPMW